MDFNLFLLRLEAKGRELYNPSFKVIPDDHEIIYQMLTWFLNDANAAKDCNISLRKGILLSGPVGCGKTTLMHLFRVMHPPNEQFIVKACRDVSYEFNQDGFAVINRYGRGSFDRNGKPKTYCFDDLGTENAIKFFGNECNVMAEILLSRYDLFVTRKMITHMTTNLNSSEIEELYGLRVRSRLREMFNIIRFPQSAKDKRT
ncbi:MAG: ATPase [Marinilabiliaceae bacterium]|nr:ATPase [Marinilabiliaceae bacterium]